MMSFQPERVQAILFDVDGTLADSDDLWVEQLSRWLHPLSRLLPRLKPDRLARRMVMAIEGPMNAAYTWWDRLHLDEMTGPLFSRLPRRSPQSAAPAPLIEGVRPMLEELQPRYRLAIVTARGEIPTRRFLRNAHLEAVFAAVITTRSARRAKPHPAPVLLAAEQLGVAPEACLMVGDTTLDVRAGLAAGAQTAAVLCGFGTVDELDAAGPHLLLPSTADLPDYLRI